MSHCESEDWDEVGYWVLVLSSLIVLMQATALHYVTFYILIIIIFVF